MKLLALAASGCEEWKGQGPLFARASHTTLAMYYRRANVICEANEDDLMIDATRSELTAELRNDVVNKKKSIEGVFISA